jgi:septal ring factor EnvC (AmiA/AmiB activator)
MRSTLGEMKRFRKAAFGGCLPKWPFQRNAKLGARPSRGLAQDPIGEVKFLRRSPHAYRERERVKQERAERERANAANAAADQRVAELESDLAELARATSTAADAFENELARVTKENAELKTKQVQLEAALAELRLTLAERAGKPLDLKPLARVN